MRRILTAVAIVSVFVLCPNIAQATTLTFSTILSGLNETPTPVITPGTGTATVILDTTALTMQVTVSFSGLLGNTTASHIHCCGPLGTSQGVATTIPTFAGFPLGVTSGFYDQTLDMTLASSYNPAFVTAQGGSVAQAQAALFAGIIAGQAYLNVHSNLFPGGEIRGQLTPTTTVPEPSSLIALMAGVGFLALVVPRQRLVR
jgi:CHRD domain